MSDTRTSLKVLFSTFTMRYIMVLSVNLIMSFPYSCKLLVMVKQGSGVSSITVANVKPENIRTKLSCLMCA